MKVIYSLSHLPDWVGFAQEMQRRLGWEPVYWLTTNVTDPMVRERFPSTTRQKYVNIIRGVSPPEVDLFKPNVVDENSIREYAYEMDQAIKMMDRLDSGDAFSYHERKRYFLKILNYSLNVVDHFDPDLILFTETPHHATQYILYAVCQKRNVKTLMFKPAMIYDLRLFIYNSVSDDPFQTLGNISLNERDGSVHAKVAEYIQKLKGDYTKAEPEYMKKQNKTSNHSKTYWKTLGRLLTQEKLKDLLDKERTTNVLKLKGKQLEESVPNRLQLYWIKIRGSFKKRRLKKLYNDLVVKHPDTTKPFVFIPLQYQPERTSSPDGGVYVEQYLMVSLLRNCFPENVPIFIKEHTSQFHPRMEGHLGRFEFNYDDFTKLKNVHLISTTYSSFELIDKCLCVATLTGTVGLEAVARHKPVLIFGAGCWYRSMPGVFYTPDQRSLEAAASRIQRGEVSFNDADFAAFLAKFSAISFRGRLTPTFPLEISSEQNISNFSVAVEKYVKTVFADQYAH